MNPADDDVLERLRREAAGHREATYPGDLVADIRSRLAARRPGSVARWRAAAAAALVGALAAHLASRGPSPGPRIAPSLSPFQTLPRVSALSAPRTLSPPPSEMGRALRFGAAALSSLQPPSRAGSVPEEERR